MASNLKKRSDEIAEFEKQHALAGEQQHWRDVKEALPRNVQQVIEGLARKYIDEVRRDLMQPSYRNELPKALNRGIYIQNEAEMRAFEALQALKKKQEASQQQQPPEAASRLAAAKKAAEAYGQLDAKGLAEARGDIQAQLLQQKEAMRKEREAAVKALYGDKGPQPPKLR